MAYTRVVWQNTPDKSTPLSAENLNKMDVAIANLDSTMSQVRSEANGARLYAEDANALATENQGRLDNLDTTIEQLEGQVDNLVKDLGDNFIIFDGALEITPVMQHTVQIGPLIFVHFAFKFSPTESTTSLIGHVSYAPKHTHSFTFSSASPNAADMRSVVGRINSDKSIYIEYLKSDVPSGAYVLDVEFFYCMDH